MATESFDGFEVVTITGGEVIAQIECTTNHESARERTMMGIMRNMRDDCFVRDTRDALNTNTEG